MKRDIAMILRLGAWADLEELFSAVEALVVEKRESGVIKVTTTQRVCDAYDAVMAGPGDHEKAAHQAVEQLKHPEVVACPVCCLLPRAHMDGTLYHRCVRGSQAILWEGDAEQWKTYVLMAEADRLNDVVDAQVPRPKAKVEYNCPSCGVTIDVPDDEWFMCPHCLRTFNTRYIR